MTNNANPSTKALSKIQVVFPNLITIQARLYSGTDKKAGLDRHEYLEVPVLEEEAAVDPDTGEPILDEVTGEPTFVKVPKMTTIETPDGPKAVPVVENHAIGRASKDKNAPEGEDPILTPEQLSKVQRKVETEYGPVYVEDHEIEQLFTLEPNVLRIHTFQPQHLFHSGNYVPRELNHLEPERVGGSGAKRNDFNPLALALLTVTLEAMRKEGVVAVGELTTRGVPKPVVITPDSRIWICWHNNEVRAAREMPEVNVSPDDVAKMRQIIEQHKTTEVFDMTDKRSPLIQDFADQKAAAGDFGRTEDTFVEKAPVEATMDLSSLLQASLDAAKKAS